MNMTTFTDKQLEVMAKESTPRGIAAKKELDRRKGKQPETKAKESVTENSEQEDKPKRSRRKRQPKAETKTEE